jgi:anti-anti-sigma factor
VPFVDSAGLGALIGAIRRVREVGGEVVVACPCPTLTRLFDTPGFDRIVIGPEDAVRPGAGPIPIEPVGCQK